MCTWLSWVLDALAIGGVGFFAWFGRLFLLTPARYLRAFAEVRLEIFRVADIPDEEVNRRPHATLIGWLVRKPYTRWLRDLAQSPQGHPWLLAATRLGGVVMLALSVLLGVALLVSVPAQVQACLRP